MAEFMISGFSDEISPEITKQFEHLNKLKIGFFEPRGVDGKNISELCDDEAEELKKKMDSFGIKASSIGSPIGKIDIKDDFDKHITLLNRVIKTAKMLGAKYIRIFSFYISDGDFKGHRAEVIRRMKKMTEIAESEGVILLHENEKGIYGETAERCLDILKEVDSQNLRAVFDPANFVQCGEKTFPDAFLMLKDYVEYMHIKDATSDGTVVPAGEGEGKLKEILSSLKAADYNGFLSLEPHLGNFEGLGALEKSDEMLKLSKSTAEKFTLAYNSLNKIIEEI